MQRFRDSSGQAAVELMAVLPLIALLGAVAVQCVLYGQSRAAAGSAARAAARAQAVGGDPVSAARMRVPVNLKQDLRVTHKDGKVSVRVRVPAIVKGVNLGFTRTDAYMERQQ